MRDRNEESPNVEAIASLKRRRLLCYLAESLSCSMIATQLVKWRLDRSHYELDIDGRQVTLLEVATFVFASCDQVGGHIERPISRLQGQFKLAYSRACALAEKLEQSGIWTIGVNQEGLRIATIHRSEAVWYP